MKTGSNDQKCGHYIRIFHAFARGERLLKSYILIQVTEPLQGNDEKQWGWKVCLLRSYLAIGLDESVMHEIHLGKNLIFLLFVFH